MIERLYCYKCDKTPHEKTRFTCVVCGYVRKDVDVCEDCEIFYLGKMKMMCCDCHYHAVVFAK